MINMRDVKMGKRSRLMAARSRRHLNGWMIDRDNQVDQSKEEIKIDHR